MSGFEIRLALQGDLQKYLEEQEAVIAKATTDAARQTGKDVQALYREALVRAGLGNKLPRTIRTKTYPEQGTSLEPATLIWSKAPHILAGLVQSSTITGTGGNWLAIPTENAPKRLMRKRITPDVYEQRYGAGRLQFVSLVPGRSGMLVDTDLREKKGKRGGFAPRTAKSRSAAVAMPIFWLVKQVRTRKVVDLADIEQRGRSMMRDGISAEIARALSDEAGSAASSGRSRNTGPRSRRRIA